MDINRLFRAGMKACGRVLRVLPKDEIGTPLDYMMEVLRDSTLPSLNIIFPRLFAITFGVNQLIPVSDTIGDVSLELQDKIQLDGVYTFYRIPKKVTEGQDIVLVKSCIPVSNMDNTSSNRNTYGDVNILHNWASSRGYGRYSSANLYEAAAYAQLNYADRQLAGQFTNAFRYKFYPPNILGIVNGYAGDNLILRAEFGLTNDESLLTIEDTAYEEIRKLFILDLRSTIYNEYGLFGSVSTENGNLDLKIDEWSSAENERNELYKEHLATCHFRTSSMRTG